MVAPLYNGLALSYHAGVSEARRRELVEDGMSSAIDEAFAKPVVRDEDIGDYVPT